MKLSIFGAELTIIGRGICILVIIGLISGCTAFGVTPPPPDMLIIGNMVFTVTDTLHIDRSRISRSQYLIGFDAKEWRLASSPIGDRSTISYHLRGRRLRLALDVNLRLSQDRVPPSQDIREVIIVDGRFKDRDGDLLVGPFSGIISYETIRNSFNEYRQEWSRYRRSSRTRSVVGTCFVNEQPTESLWVIPPSSEE